MQVLGLFMKAARIAILGLALGAGFVAYTMMANQKPQVVEVRQEAPRVETVDVLVASRDLTMGTVITGPELRWHAFPRDAVSAGFITRDGMPDALEQFEGGIARMPLLQGEPVNTRKVVQRDRGGFMSAMLSSGMRAVATEISAQSSAGGFILPNDRVDLLLTRSGNTSSQPFVTETILKNVRVLAIDQLIEEKQGQQVVIGQTATLELSPSQTEVLALANRIGTVSLSLRPLADTNEPEEVVEKNDQRLTVMRYGISRQSSGVQ